MILVFDFDGTLHQTDTIYGYAVRKVLRELSFPVPEEKLKVTDMELARYLGVNASDMWADFLPQLPKDQRPDIIARVGAYMIEGILNGATRLYEGIPESLDQLKAAGHTLIILSNCTIAYMEAQKKSHNLEQWFTDFYCSEAYHNAPKEKIFEEIKKKYPGEYVIIGDRASDIRVALTHHIHSVGCSYGYGTADELQHADIILSNPTPGDALFDIIYTSVNMKMKPWII